MLPRSSSFPQVAPTPRKSMKVGEEEEIDLSICPWLPSILFTSTSAECAGVSPDDDDEATEVL